MSREQRALKEKTGEIMGSLRLTRSLQRKITWIINGDINMCQKRMRLFKETFICLQQYREAKDVIVQLSMKTLFRIQCEEGH
ncbi:hypothetical protein RND71_013829 [Anisodus tanguticus]|uniref:Uncharacterized protein n=1 Tax=Anisodus tanguticus TaxID=243964 RepID=A0AAE1VM44_9SOLA|nr:hypothetical protein RND71_013829 [Anisodus tanguticus]